MAVKRRFRIEASSRGGELTIGQVNKEFVDYMIDKDEEDLIATVQSYEWSDEEMGDKDAPKILEDFVAWNECDEIEHLNAGYADGEWFVNEVPADGSDDYGVNANELGFNPDCLYGREAYHEQERPEPTKHRSQEDIDNMIPVLTFHSSEKGTFACWFVETEGEDFDSTKLTFSKVETNIAEIVEDVWYDKEKLDLEYESSTTTGSHFSAQVGFMNLKSHDKLEKYSSETLVDYWNEHDDEITSNDNDEETWDRPFKDDGGGGEK